MPPFDVEKATRQLARYRMSASDMRQAIEAGFLLERLNGPQPPLDANVWLRRVIESGLVTSYGRAFVVARSSRFMPAEGSAHREVHDWLMALRDTAHAHNDLDGDTKWIRELD